MQMKTDARVMVESFLRESVGAVHQFLRTGESVPHEDAIIWLEFWGPENESSLDLLLSERMRNENRDKGLATPAGADDD